MPLNWSLPNSSDLSSVHEFSLQLMNFPFSCIYTVGENVTESPAPQNPVWHASSVHMKCGGVCESANCARRRPRRFPQELFPPGPGIRGCLRAREVRGENRPTRQLQKPQTLSPRSESRPRRKCPICHLGVILSHRPDGVGVSQTSKNTLPSQPRPRLNTNPANIRTGKQGWWWRYR